jgi:hypothetical protein
MTLIVRLLEDTDKRDALIDATAAFRSGNSTHRTYDVSPAAFSLIPGSPFAYWVHDEVRASFQKFPCFESNDRASRQGLATGDDPRFVRAWWEVDTSSGRWFSFAKGGTFSPFYSDVYLVVNWEGGGREICNFKNLETGKTYSRPQNTEYFLRPGLTWPRRTKSRLSMRAMPKHCIFADKGPASFVGGNDSDELLALLSIACSATFHTLVELQLAAADARAGGAAHSFEVGVIQKTPRSTPSHATSMNSRRRVA